jgi:hypothetical protein
LIGSKHISLVKVAVVSVAMWTVEVGGTRKRRRDSNS